MGVVVLLSIIIVLAIILFIVVSRDDSGREPLPAVECYEKNTMLIIDKLQTGDLEGIEGLFKEILNQDSSKADFYVLLANIVRDRGYISEAINMHKNVLNRHDVDEDKIFKGWVLGNLAEDFRQGGMIDRALRTYNDALALLTEKASIPKKFKIDVKGKKKKDNEKEKTVTPVEVWIKSLLKRYILLCKQVGDYKKLLGLIEMYGAMGGYADEHDQKREVAFIYNQLGEEEMKKGDKNKAEAYFRKGLTIYRELYPSYINLAMLNKDSRPKKSIEFIEDLIEEIPSKGFLVLPLFKELAVNGFEDVCNKLLNNNDNDWRVRLELGRYYMEKGEREKGLLEFKRCLKISPMVLIVHQEVWKYLLKNPEDIKVFREYANTLNKVLVFNNPFICSKCNYKSSEFLWKCPYCHEFDTFVELKI